MRLIDADALAKKICNRDCKNCEYYCLEDGGCSDVSGAILDLIGKIPTIPNGMDEVFHFMSFFPNSFITYRSELIVSDIGNVYFMVHSGMSKVDICCKILEVCSRNIAEYYPYRNSHSNNKWREKLISGFNSYLGTSFDWEDFQTIYDRIGYGVNHERTLRFILSGYDMNVLKEGCECH